jgi:hypothetical protein
VIVNERAALLPQALFATTLNVPEVEEGEKLSVIELPVPVVGTPEPEYVHV